MADESTHYLIPKAVFDRVCATLVRLPYNQVAPLIRDLEATSKTVQRPDPLAAVKRPRSLDESGAAQLEGEGGCEPSEGRLP